MTPVRKTEEQHWAEFGKWLSGQRIRQRLKKTEAAEGAGISFSTWVSLEAGGRTMAGKWVLPKPTPETIAGVARAIGVPQREVFQKAGMEAPQDELRTNEDDDRLSALEGRISDLADLLGDVMKELRTMKQPATTSRRRAG